MAIMHLLHGSDQGSIPCLPTSTIFGGQRWKHQIRRKIDY